MHIYLASIEAKLISQQKNVLYEQELSQAIQSNSLNRAYVFNRLRQLQQTLGLTASEVASIEAKLISQQKNVLYEQELSQAIQSNSLNRAYVFNRLRQLQQTLGLTASEVASIEARLVSQQKNIAVSPKIPVGSQKASIGTVPLGQQHTAEYQQKLQQYEQELSQAIQSNSLNKAYVFNRLRQLQQTLGLTGSELVD